VWKIQDGDDLPEPDSGKKMEKSCTGGFPLTTFGTILLYTVALTGTEMENRNEPHP
jgi:hypothetical protein